MFVVVNFDALAQQTISKSKRDKLSSFDECRTRTQGLWNRISSRLNMRISEQSAHCMFVVVNYFIWYSKYAYYKSAHIYVYINYILFHYTLTHSAEYWFCVGKYENLSCDQSTSNVTRLFLSGKHQLTTIPMWHFKEAAPVSKWQRIPWVCSASMGLTQDMSLFAEKYEYQSKRVFVLNPHLFIVPWGISW